MLLSDYADYFPSGIAFQFNFHEQAARSKDPLHFHRPALNCDKQHPLSCWKMNRP